MRNLLQVKDDMRLISNVCTCAMAFFFNVQPVYTSTDGTEPFECENDFLTRNLKANKL